MCYDNIYNLLGKKCMLQILQKMGGGQPKRFNGLLKELGRISTKTLSERLKELERCSLVNRKSFSEIPPRVEYTLTEKGTDLVERFQCFESWAEKWEANE